MKKIQVSFILDETGSMSAVKQQTIDGFNEYIGALKSEEGTGRIRFTLTKFNSSKIELIHKRVKLDKVDKLTDETYLPNHTTPLYDAIGQTIKSLEEQLTGKKKQRALVVVQTDGYENSSREFSQRDIFDLIEEKKGAGWTFVFLGADQDAFAAGSQLGIDVGNIASYRSTDSGAAFKGAARATTHYVHTGGAQTASLFDDSERGSTADAEWRKQCPDSDQTQTTK
jgi:hypothetical protein